MGFLKKMPDCQILMILVNIFFSFHLDYMYFMILGPVIVGLNEYFLRMPFVWKGYHTDKKYHAL